MQNIDLISFASADELARTVANAWLDEIEPANRAGKTHCVALSGGRITQKFFIATVEQAKARKISFEPVHFFWADERCVPPTDPESNFKLASELLFSPLKIPASQIHRIRGEAPPDQAVMLATAELIRMVPILLRAPASSRPGGSRKPQPAGETPALPGNSPPALDLIFLGMGEDGHVASLFPDAPPEILNCAGPYLAIENSPKPPPRRISLSYAAIAAARQVWVLVSGAGKQAALRESLRPGGRTPLARVLRSRSRTKIFLRNFYKSGLTNL